MFNGCVKMLPCIFVLTVCSATALAFRSGPMTIDPIDIDLLPELVQAAAKSTNMINADRKVRVSWHFMCLGKGTSNRGIMLFPVAADEGQAKEELLVYRIDFDQRATEYVGRISYKGIIYTEEQRSCPAKYCAVSLDERGVGACLMDSMGNLSEEVRQ